MSKREDILVALEAALATVPGIKTVVRNHSVIDDTMMPCLLLIDGDEDASEPQDLRSRKPIAPRHVAMTPQIYLYADGESEDVGPLVNEFLFQVQKRVFQDATLADLVGTSGYIQYNGMLNELAFGRAMTGMMNIKFTFGYIIEPARF